VSELVTNAYEATMKLPEPQVLVLRTFVNASALHIEVWDASPGMPKLQDPTDDLPGGRGLVIVEALSTCWGAHYGPQGTPRRQVRLGPVRPTGSPIRNPRGLSHACRARSQRKSRGGGRP